MTKEIAKSYEGLGVAAEMAEIINRQTEWTVEKRIGDINAFMSERMRDLYDASPEEIERAREYWQHYWHENTTPYETLHFGGNILVTVGMTLMWTLVTGGSGTPYSSANAYLGVGNSNTAESVGQTDLQGASTQRKAMNATYPTVAGAVVTFQSTFGSAEANFTWLEVGTFNAAAAGTMLNRKVPSGGLGTKGAGASWTLTETITLS